MPERAWGPFYVGSIYDLGTKKSDRFQESWFISMLCKRKSYRYNKDKKFS